MATRVRKKRRVVDVPCKDDFVDLEASEGDDVMCSQFVDDDVYDDKSSSDVEILSDDSSSGGSPIRSFNRSLYEKYLRDDGHKIRIGMRTTATSTRLVVNQLPIPVMELP